jgi:glycosyl hydrolase family 26
MHRHRRLLHVALGAIAVVVAITLVSYLAVDHDAAERGGAVPAAGGIYLGVYAPNRQPDRYDTTEVQALEARVGRRFAIDQHYYSWTDPFPTDLEPTDRSAGRLSMVSWKPNGVSLTDIASGRYDELVRTRAAAMKAFGGPILLRFGHEPNGDWYSWSEHYDRGPVIAGNTAASYVAAWRHVHDVFAKAGADNVSWVWSVNYRDFPAGNSADDYYPGDDVVDWIGIDAYNSGDVTPATSWTGIGPLIAPMYGRYAKRKPIMLTEVGSVEQGGDKAAWVNGLAAELPDRYPDVKAVIWFSKAAYRVDSSSAALSAFTRMATSKTFSAARPG